MSSCLPLQSGAILLKCSYSLAELLFCCPFQMLLSLIPVLNLSFVTYSSLYSILHIPLLRLLYGVWCVSISDFSYPLVPACFSSVDTLFDLPHVFLFYHRVCQQQYLLLLQLLFYVRMFIMESYNQLLLIVPLLS